MSFDINSIKPTKRETPLRIVVYGEDKIGKSTFASGAEGPVFIPTEDGQENIDAQAFPLCRTWDEVMDAVGVLYTAEHKHKTAILDTADWAEALSQQKVVNEAKADSIVSKGLGYGEGYRRSSDLFRGLLDGLNALRTDKGMQIIVLCHAEVKKFDDPLAESYDRYQMKLHSHVNRMLQEWADVIGFAQVAGATKKEDAGFNKTRTRVLDLGRRVLNLQPNVAFDAGNRYDLPAEINLIWSEFSEALKAARTK